MSYFLAFRRAKENVLVQRDSDTDLYWVQPFTQRELGGAPADPCEPEQDVAGRNNSWVGGKTSSSKYFTIYTEIREIR